MILGVAVFAHLWLVRTPPADAPNLPSRLPGFASIALSHAVPEAAVEVVHEDLVVPQTGEPSRENPLRTDPVRRSQAPPIQAARREPLGVPVATTGSTASGGNGADEQPAFNDLDAGTAQSSNREPIIMAAQQFPEELAESAPVVHVPEASLARVALPDVPARAGLPSAAAHDAAAELERQEQVVAQILRDYTRAYERLDVRAAKELWPSVDARKLQRAFTGLEGQQLRLESCKTSISGQGANARCQGKGTYRPRIGSQVVRTTSEWTFNLSRNDGAWQIVDLRIQ